MNYLIKLVTKKSTIISMVVFALFMAFVLPYVSGLSEELTNGIQGVDTLFLFSKADVYQMVESFGVTGRMNYIILRWTFDLIWPIVYFMFIHTLTIQVVQLDKVDKLKWMIWIPFLGMMFDYIENTLASIVVGIYPVKIDVFVWLLQVATPIKWILIMTAFTVLLVGLVVVFIRRVSNVKLS